jgi:GNAT superfamily N-acetyltransferase
LIVKNEYNIDTFYTKTKQQPKRHLEGDMDKEKKGYDFKPVTSKNWNDLEELFGPRGACAGCWCMYWRVPRKEFTKGQGEPFRKALKDLVDGGTIPGLLAYEGGKAVGWISVGRRVEFVLLSQSKVLAPVDDLPVWSIVCFFIAKTHRKQGLMLPMINAAVDHAAKRGAKIVEAYPMDPYKRLGGVSAYVGITTIFEKAGFTEAARRSEHHPVMRKYLN